jgi:signal transduction histidine kinase
VSAGPVRRPRPGTPAGPDRRPRPGTPAGTPRRPRPGTPAGPGRPLDAVGSIKAKLGLLVGASVLVAALLAQVGDRAGLPVWVTLPVTVGAALLVTQWLARGMTSPLRAMTDAATRMAAGDWSVRVGATSDDEVGRLARAFDAMAGELEATDRERRQLVATVAHELRTPLTAQRALLENLADGVVQPDDAALGAALQQAERLSDLVADLLDLSRIDAGAAPLRLGDVDLEALVRSVVEEGAGQDRAASVEVAVEPAGLTVRADPGRLAQVVANLVDNAVRHSPAGRVVRLAATADGDRWHLDVRDEGPGIPADLEDRVFERFGTGPDAGGGTGLGLAITRWVCELHGGTVAVVPSDAGAHLRATLPRDPRPTARPTTDTTPRPVRSSPMPETEPTTLTQPAVGDDAAASGCPPPGRLDDLLARLWPERDLPPQVPLLLASGGVGVLASALVVDQRVGVGAFLVALAVAAVVLVAARRGPVASDRFTVAGVVLGVALAALTVLRASEWIGLLGVVVAGTTLAVAVTGARSVVAVPGAAAVWVAASVRGLPLLGRTLTATSRSRLLWPVLRTVGLAAAGLVLFGGLFASGDAVFGSWASSVVPDLAWDSLVARGFVWFFAAGVTLTGCYVALNPPPVLAQDLALGRPVRNRWEWLVPLGTVIALFVAFLVAQSAAMWGGHEYLARTTGLTYAEYVHQGFGQLTAVTALVLVVIGVAARKAPRERRGDRLVLQGALGLLCVLALAVVASALYRMSVYQEAYGYTVLRLVVDAFELWLGLVVVLALVAVLRLSGTWLPRAVVLSGAAALLALGLLNPAGFVAAQNVDRYAATGLLDVDYLASLGDDAVPAVVEGLPADVAACVLAQGYREDSSSTGLWEWNLGRDRAEDARARLDGVEPSTTCTSIPRGGLTRG